MAVTQNSFTGNGSTTNYSFTFPYLKSSEVKASLDATVTTAFTLANATTVQFNTAPGNGVKIKIYRETDDAALTATFYAGSAIKSEDLNDNFTQNLYTTQEVNARFLSNLGGTMTGDLTMDEDADIVFEGATADAHETTLTVADPTADRTITLPNVTGTVVTTGDTGTVTATMLAANSVDSSELVDGSVDLSHMSANSVDSDQYVDGSIDLAHMSANSVDSDQYVDGSIDLVHMSANSVDSDQYVDGSIDTAHIADAQVTQAKLANNSVGSAQILDAHVTTAKLASDAVTTVKITDSNVTTAKIADNAITEAKVLNGAISINKIADTAVGINKLTTNSVSTVKIVDGNVTTAKIANDAVTTAKIAADAITGAEIADDAINSEHYTDGSIDTAHIAAAQVTDAKLASNAVTTAKITDANVTTAKVADDAITIAKIGCEQTTISDSDSHVPTSGAVVDYVAAQIAPIGGLEVIADEDNFPSTQPSAGVVISIADAGGVVVNGSGVSTTARTAGNGSDNVTINGFPSDLQSTTLAASVGLMVTSTGSSNTYNYHKALLKEADLKNLSSDIDDFGNRYRVHAGEPSSNNDDGDLVWDTNADKMKVYDATASAWTEVTSTGEFKYLFLCPAGGTGAPTLNGSIATYDLREGSNSGSAASVTNAAQLIVSINGVVQKANTGTSAPAEGFALADANTIVFGANLASGDSVFIVQIGSAVSIPTPGDGTVSAAKIASGAVTTAKIADANVTLAKMAANSIDSDQYVDGSIDTAHLANLAVTTAKIASGQITESLIATDAVDETRLKVSNSPTNGYFLSAQSGDNGGLTWAEAGGGVTSDSDSNTVAGTDAGNAGTWSGATNNSCYGHDAGTAITDGDNNTYIGDSAGAAATTASGNVAVGKSALAVSTTGWNNVAIGSLCMTSGDVTGNNNVAVGNEALERLTSASYCCALGQDALEKVTSGNNNIGIGRDAGGEITTETGNVCIGAYALTDCTDSYNVAVGYNAGKEISTGNKNVCIGYEAIKGVNAQTTGDYNVVIGDQAGFALTTAGTNTLLGSMAGYAVTTGSTNTIVGREAGKGVTTGQDNVLLGANAANTTNILTTGQKNICIGNYAHTSAVDGDYQTIIGYNLTGKGDSTSFIYGAIYAGNNSASLSTTSDRRIKKNIVDNNDGLSKINSIRVRNFEYRTFDEITELDNPAAAVVEKEGTQLGVIAQEIMEVLPDVVKQESTGAYSVNPDNLTWYLVNAVKELSAKVTELEAKVNG